MTLNWTMMVERVGPVNCRLRPSKKNIIIFVLPACSPLKKDQYFPLPNTHTHVHILTPYTVLCRTCTHIYTSHSTTIHVHLFIPYTVHATHAYTQTIPTL